MENVKKTKTIPNKSELPEPVITHIQSFLTRKQAAVTSVLSKSWYNSWLSRPNLDFDERDFHKVKPFSPKLFSNFVTKTLEKCSEINLGIISFKLWMNVRNNPSCSLANECIIKAVKLGAKIVDIEINAPYRKYVLPIEVFESESLISLSVNGFEIEGIYCGRVKCTKLESISLVGVTIRDDTLMNVICGCPLLENVFLSGCYGELTSVSMSELVKLEKLSFINQTTNGKQMSYVHGYVSVMDCLTNVAGFRTLICLVLEKVEIDGVLFHDFSSKFPCITDLTVSHCSGDLLRLDISSDSLKYVTFDLDYMKTNEVHFDAPNILKFKFMGSRFPYLTFTTASSEWVSELSINCYHYSGIDISWFRELSKFLTHFSASKIYLNIQLPTDPVARYLLDFHDLPNPPIVYDLTLEARYAASVCSPILDAVFWSLQPKFISHRFFPIPHKSGEANNKHKFRPQIAKSKLMQFIYNKLTDLENGYDSLSSGTRICWNTLEEVNAESFDGTFMGWRPLPWETLFDDLRMTADKEVQIRFRLKWGPPDVDGPNQEVKSTSEAIHEQLMQSDNSRVDEE